VPTPVHLDLSELIARPLYSGIQRIEREAIRHWPGPAPLVPCLISGEGELLQLSAAVLEALCTDNDGSEVCRASERQILAQLAAEAKPLSTDVVKRLLNLELFFAPARAGAYIHLAAIEVRVLWYLHDFLPFLRPELFSRGTSRNCMHFLRGLRSVTSLAFPSTQTRRDYILRVARTSSQGEVGPVLAPGADGLQLERQYFSRDRQDFVAIGTVEPRKNTHAMLAAFESLWSAGTMVRLIVAGRISPEATEALDFFTRYAGNPCLLVLQQPADEALRVVLRGARAVIMPSEAEGFGLPPYEAVHSGIPAIASASVPSTALLSGGTKLLEQMDPASIAAAVMSLLDDETAERLWTEAADVRLPTWAAFGRALGDWAQSA
jgi:glycosyltransferase involved in cell wall biosynthesis